ncbi:MAG: AsmA-like C-terminal region-containing protein [Opitutaceae bacterium]|jgi:hypothetical protein
MRVILWSTWLLLLAIFAGQIYLLSSRHVPVPGPLRLIVEDRLAEHGLRLRYSRGRMDFAGHLILENVRVSPFASPGLNATARTLYLHLDPWSLLLGRVELEELRVDGLDFHLPAARSPSGADELPVHDVDISLRPIGREIELSYFNGYVGRMPVHIDGRFRLPEPQAAPVQATQSSAGQAASVWLDFSRRAQDAASRLVIFDAPELRLRLNPAVRGPGIVSVRFDAQRIDLGSLPGAAAGYLTGVRLNTTLSLDTLLTSPLEISGTADSLDLPTEKTAVRGLAFHLRGSPGGPLGLKSPVLDLQVGSLRWRDINIAPIAVSASQPEADQVRADLSLTVAGSPWRLQVDTAPLAGTARLELDGYVDDEMLIFVGGLIQHDLNELLDPVQAAPLNVVATFAPGWKLSEAHGRLHSGSVRVGGAQLDETGTEFIYDGAHVLCDNLVLRQGASLAHGSYEMDTQTMDFRFLLTGGLRPMGISSWFHDWWSNFWSTFDFDRAIPPADVDVRGRWGDLTATNVFVQAAGPDIGLKGVAFDHVSTRLFLRPHWFDIRHFAVSLDKHGAEGWLTRSLDPEKDTWRYMEFSVDSNLPLETIEHLFKAESAELLAPYRFTTPPQMRLSGRVDSEASPVGKQERIDINLTSTGAMTYHGFPLSDLGFQAHLKNDVIELPELSVVFAGGKAQGQAKLWGDETSRRLSFDIALARANLGAVTQSISQLQPPGTTSPTPEKTTEASRARQERFDRGELDFNLKAEGLYADFYSFHGTGKAVITGSELGQLNLFGPLSEALSGTFINLGSFSLTSVDAPFVLNGDRVRFDELRVTGPSALIQAKGNYQLRDGTLNFTTKVRPFDESSSIVGNAVGFVLTPLSKVFEVKLQGTLAKPSWIFSYGPSSLLNSLTGSEKTRAPEVSPNSPSGTSATPAIITP